MYAVKNSVESSYLAMPLPTLSAYIVEPVNLLGWVPDTTLETIM